MRTEDIIKTLTIFETTFADAKADDGLTKRTREHLQAAIKIIEALEDYETLYERLRAIEAIYAYYVTSRAVGHTQLMLDGVRKRAEENFDGADKDFFIVIGAGTQRQQFNGYDTILYDKIGSNIGINRPLIWDNFAILRMVASLAPASSTFRIIRDILNGQNDR